MLALPQGERALSGGDAQGLHAGIIAGISMMGPASDAQTGTARERPMAIRSRARAQPRAGAARR
jgi:hypothetical protein